MNDHRSAHALIMTHELRGYVRTPQGQGTGRSDQQVFLSNFVKATPEHLASEITTAKGKFQYSYT